tara:strand:- start:420 stop:686 length:267 start_codon:yes stop_codon:yes gene_type:complete
MSKEKYIVFQIEKERFREDEENNKPSVFLSLNIKEIKNVDPDRFYPGQSLCEIAIHGPAQKTVETQFKDCEAYKKIPEDIDIIIEEEK